MNHLRVQVVKTTRKDLMCIACGGFGSGSPMLAIVAPEQPSMEAHAGVHRRCILTIKAKRKSPAPPAAAVAHAEADCPCHQCECACHETAGSPHVEAECPCHACDCGCHARKT